MSPRRCLNPQDLFSEIQSHEKIFIHGGAASPTPILKGLVSHAQRLRGVELLHLHLEGEVPYLDPKFKENFQISNLFVGSQVRTHFHQPNVDYIPCFLSEIPELFRSGVKALDWALVQVSPPDVHGYCTLGVSVDVARAAVDSARRVIAWINPRMPRTHGDAYIPLSKFTAYFEQEAELPEVRFTKGDGFSAQDLAIGKNVAALVEDGACLQAGIGAIPNAVMACLKNHRKLGIHTEMWSDGMLDLILSGAVDNSQKSFHQGKIVSSFILGSRRVYDFIHDNPSVVQLGADVVNSPSIIAQNSKVVAVNSAVEVDLTGQVCADSVGHRIISGVGGQMDFMRGASLSAGGKPIIAISSRSAKGAPRIVAELKPGAGVVTTRAHVQYVVTEYGVADLFGKGIKERSKALIAIAHPEDRENLSRQFWQLHMS